METKTLTLQLGSLIRILGPALSFVSASEAADQNCLTLETREHPVANIANIGRSGNRGLRRSHSEGEIPLRFMERHFPEAWREHLRTRGSEALSLELSLRDQEDSDRDIMIIDAILMLIEARNENQIQGSLIAAFHVDRNSMRRIVDDLIEERVFVRDEITGYAREIAEIRERISAGVTSPLDAALDLGMLEQRISRSIIYDISEAELL